MGLSKILLSEMGRYHLVTCDRNWVPGPGSKMYYPVLNPGSKSR